MVAVAVVVVVVVLVVVVVISRSSIVVSFIGVVRFHSLCEELNSNVSAQVRVRVALL